jgi:hypothetical protein
MFELSRYSLFLWRKPPGGAIFGSYRVVFAQAA